MFAHDCVLLCSYATDSKQNSSKTSSRVSARSISNRSATRSIYAQCVPAENRVDLRRRVIFGESLGNPVADDLLLALRAAGAVGLTRSEMSRDVFGRNRSAGEIERALALLKEHGLARGEVDRSGAGRPVERWFPSVTN